MKRIIRHVPNILTILRLCAVPVFALLMIENRMTEAMWVFLAAEATDILDGAIARKFNVMTVFGRIADPAADKLLQLTALFSLAYLEIIPVIIPWLFFIKELFMLVAGILAIRSKMDTSARWYGKAASALLFGVIMLTFFLRESPITTVLMWGCVCMTLFALIMYGRNYLSHRRKT